MIAVSLCSHPELLRDRTVLIPPQFSRPLRIPIEPGGHQAVCRVFFTNAKGESCCIDSRVLTRASAIRLATRLAQSGERCEVLKWWTPGNYCRPPDYKVHRVRRLDDCPPALIFDSLTHSPTAQSADNQSAFVEFRTTVILK